MVPKQDAIIVKFDFSNDQTVGEITKIVGLVMAKYLVPVIDHLDLEANPRASRTGPVTAAIQDSIETDPATFPFKTKGVLLAASQYERLERNRVKITPSNPSIEGILDGGHNTLAIGLYILQNAMEYTGGIFPKGPKTWRDFKTLWQQHRGEVETYLAALKKDPDHGALHFYVPVELLVPRNPNDLACVESFKGELLEICAARNNNVQLQVSDKANQLGYFDVLKELMDARNPAVSSRIAWKTNDGGDIKAQDIVALAWIPLGLMTSVKDQNGRTMEPVSVTSPWKQERMPVSWLYPVRKTLPVSSASKSRPSRAGMVLLEETAREAVRMAFWSSAFSQLNFMEKPPIVSVSLDGGFGAREGEQEKNVVVVVVGEFFVESGGQALFPQGIFSNRGVWDRLGQNGEKCGRVRVLHTIVSTCPQKSVEKRGEFSCTAR